LNKSRVTPIHSVGLHFILPGPAAAHDIELARIVSGQASYFTTRQPLADAAGVRLGS
jgi:hypothetical protein